MSRSVKAVARVSQALAGYISSLSENENAATRALILLGAAELGIDPTLVDDDLRLTMAAPLPPELYARLQAIRDRVDQRASARGRPEAAMRLDGLSTPRHTGSVAPPSPAPPVELSLPPRREPGIAMAGAGPSAVASPGAGRITASHEPPPQVHAALSQPSNGGADDDAVASPGSPVWSVHPEDAAGGDEESFDPFSGIGFDFDDPRG